MGFENEGAGLPEELRHRVRAFLDDERRNGRFAPRANAWMHYDKDFTRQMADRGFIGITFPKEYGGQGASALARYAITEEVLAAGAPVGMHWIAERQSGPQILKHGTQVAKQTILPRITAGECCIAIGMSEPGAGSDLASVRTRAIRADGGWLVTGTKLWTSQAQRADYMIALVRTGDPVPQKHAGLTQLIIDMRAAGVSISPIEDMTGARDFNEVALDNVLVPDDFVLGSPGDGWQLVTGELAYERSGPERLLSSYPVLEAFYGRLAAQPSTEATAALGRLVAHLATLRSMSAGVAGLLEKGRSPDFEAVLVKDLGAAFEKEVIEVCRENMEGPATPNSDDSYCRLLAQGILGAPSFTLRGGTREILRSIIARQLRYG